MSSRDPETGCAWIMLIGGIICLVVWFFAVIGFLHFFKIGE